jgi:hypothetical protein
LPWEIFLNHVEEIKKNDSADWYAEQPQQNGHGGDSFRTRMRLTQQRELRHFMLIKRNAGRKVSNVATSEREAQRKKREVLRVFNFNWAVGVKNNTEGRFQ